MRAITEQWKLDRIADMDRLGITRSELSRRIGVTSAAITMLFHEQTKQSRLVDLVHEALGLRPPPDIDPSSPTAEFLHRIEMASKNFTAEERDIVLMLAEKLSARGGAK